MSERDSLTLYRQARSARDAEVARFLTLATRAVAALLPRLLARAWEPAQDRRPSRLEVSR